jgi:hypothetical protein
LNMNSSEQVHYVQKQSLTNANYFYNYALLTTANLAVGIIAAMVSIFKMTNA